VPFHATTGPLHLARKIVKRKAFKSGLVGATTGVGGLIVLPATIPIDLGLTWRIQAAVALSIAYLVALLRHHEAENSL
jgi:hypothetical protein